MEEEEILNDLRYLTQKIMSERGILQYNLSVEGKPDKGDNYVGDITFFSVTNEENGEKYNLVMKTAKRSEEIRRIMGNGKLYTREMYMYSKVFPTLQTFGKEVSTSADLNIIPKIYWVSHQEKRETIIMENLKAKGFRLWDRTKTMDLNHVLMVLKNYGKLHGFSMAMRHRKPEKFRHLTKDLDNVMIDFCESNNVDTIFKADMNNAIKLLNRAGRGDLAKKFQPIVDNLEYNFVKETKEEDKLVITHGDCWSNNMLFDYEHEIDSKPRNMYFVDFQFSTLDSPVKDLSYYIYACCDKFALDQFDLLLSTYCDSLSSTMTDLGCQLEESITVEQLKEHWTKYAIYGLTFATMIIKIAMSSSEEAPDMDEVGSGRDLGNALDIKISDVEVYNRRILDVYTHFGDNCSLDSEAK